MTLRERLRQRRQETNIKWEIIEQDYLLSIILESISLIPELRDNVVFKGGTALKKIYFGEYRFSQDLDFSVISEHQYLAENLAKLMVDVCNLATERRQGILKENIEITTAPFLGDKPHPEGQLAFGFQARYPWQRAFHTRVYAEFTFQELIVTKPAVRKIIHEYGDPCTGDLKVYTLEEIVAEKIRALLQFAKKLHERGWARSRVRDYFDIWMILVTFSEKIDLNSIPTIVQKKCAHKGIAFKDIEDIFQGALMENYESEWEAWLLDMVTELPNKENVLADLRKNLLPLFDNAFIPEKDANFFEKQ